MIYYIDGYNFIFAVGKEKEQIEVSRFEILEELSKKAEGLKVAVVFDAYNDSTELSRYDYKNIEVVYTSPGQTADEYLLDQAKLSKHPEQMAVVSNDQKLLKALKLYRANTFSFTAFFKKVKKSRAKELEKPESFCFGSKEYEYYLNQFEG